jgi:DNA-binding IclR family transcriptional regulator
MSKTVAKALTILKQFTPAAGDLGASDVSRLLGMDKVIAYRLLRTLAAEDFLVQDPSTKKYRLGPGLIELASHNLRQVPAGEVARPWMESLRDLCDETVMFVVRRGTETVVSLPLESRQPMRVAANVGDAESMHSTASGKVMLAFGPDSLFDEVLVTGLPAVTPRTLISPDKLRAEVKRVRVRGWALDNEECVAGIRALAAGVFGRRGEIEGCLAIRGPASRLTDAVIEKLAPELVRAALEVSKKLGFEPAI